MFKLYKQQTDLTIKLGKLFHAETQMVKKIICKYISSTLPNIKLMTNKMWYSNFKITEWSPGS